VTRSAVSLTALETEYLVVLDGLSELEVSLFLESWSRCGARLERSVDDAAGRSILRGALLSADRAPMRSDPEEVVATGYAELCDRLTGLITRQAISDRRHDLLMLHAGAVADPQSGAVVAFIGPSGRGKTTASMTLGQTLGYVTDETVGIRDDLTVVPYPKPLSVKLGEPERWKRQFGPASAGLIPLPDEPLRLVGLVLLDRQPDYPSGAAPRVESIGLSAALEDLVPQVSYLAERDAPLHRLRDVIASCGGLRLVHYGEAQSLMPLIGELLAAGRPTASRRTTVSSAAPRSRTEPGDHAPASDPGAVVIERLAVDDAVVDATSLIVLRESTVTVLDGIAPTIWNAARWPISPERLVAAVISVHGLPDEGDPAGMVARAVEELAEAGILRLSGAVA
jgi:hypothetical protein